MKEHEGRINLEDAKITIIAIDEKTETRLCLQGRGTLFFNEIKLAPPEEPQVEEPKVEPTPQPQAETPKPEQKEAKNDRVTLTGRVGIDPKVEETRNGKKILKVPVGVREGDQTKWHNIMFFGEKAEAMAGKVEKGKLVTVIGYKHQQEHTMRSGEKKTTEVIFGSVIQDPSKKSK